MSIRIRIYPQTNSIGARRNRAMRRQQNLMFQLQQQRLQQQLSPFGVQQFGSQFGMQQFGAPFGSQFGSQFGVAQYGMSPYASPAYTQQFATYPQTGFGGCPAPLGAFGGAYNGAGQVFAPARFYVPNTGIGGFVDSLFGRIFG